MGALKWKRSEFTVVKQPLTKDIFNEWIKKDGKTVLDKAFKETTARWFFGRRRARRILFQEAKMATRTDGAFCRALTETLDQLPVIIRKIGILIKRREYRDLYSANASMALVVIPRAVTQHDFTLFLIDNLAGFRDMSRFAGLAKYVLRAVGTEAEQLFFDSIKKGDQYLYQKGQTVILGVDPHYGWRLGGVDGHYYCGYAGKNGKDLNKKKDLRKFKSDMEDVLAGQRIHLKRLKPEDRVAVASAFRP
ncbi:MAG: hypothetical protein OEN01_08140 [Candidatus Krumholzibacteria bacterium]|nr:hypothetical protein [Candidatus Krumholzibacteria bacterium]